MLVRSQALSRLSCRGFLSALVIALAVVPLWSQAISEPDAEGAAGSPAGPAAEPAFEPAIEGEIDTPVGPGYGPRRTIRPGMSGFKPLGSRLTPTAEAEPFNTEALRARPGSTFVVKNVTGSTQGSVWGSGVYTDDSDVASAAVHAGALKEGETRDVRVVALGPRDAFDGSTHNGVTSSQYGAWRGSFAFVIAQRPRRSRPRLAASPPVDSWRSHVGETFDLEVVGSAEGTVWGTTVYTDDSPVAVAAVHAGVLDPGQHGTVRVTILPGREHYEGSSRHGVTSRPYTRRGGSYFVEPVPATLDPAAAPVSNNPPDDVANRPAVQDLGDYRGRVGVTLQLRLTGGTDGSVWGTDVFTDDSSLSAAAVHAGVLRPGETGIVKVTILAGRNSYTGATRNGVTSRDWGPYAGSFNIQRADLGERADQSDDSPNLEHLDGSE